MKSNDELVVLNNPKNVTSEAIRTLRTNIQFAGVDKKIHTLLLTSAESGDGKSFVASNLAISFANIDTKVLIIDCDTRLGRVHEIFGLNNRKGLSDLLLEDIDQYDRYIQKTDVPNLSILTMGTIPPNPSELLDSKKNKDLIAKLKKEYDLIIFDSPPVNGLPDALILTVLCDATILVASFKKTKLDSLREAKKSLENVNGNVIGVVLNKDSGTRKYYYYNKYYTK